MPRSRRSSVNSDYSTTRNSYKSPGNDTFRAECEAAYLSVLPSTKKRLTTKEQLKIAIQQAGRNPSKKQTDEIWRSHTDITFDQFCDILHDMKPNSKNDLIKAFKKFDLNGDGHISHSELSRVLTSQGEKMSEAEVERIFEDADVNKDGKLDYSEFCTLILSTSQKCQQMNFKRMQMKKEEVTVPKSNQRPISATSAGSGRRTPRLLQRFSSVELEEDEGKYARTETNSNPRPTPAKRTPVLKERAPVLQGNMDNTVKIKCPALSGRKVDISLQKAYKNWSHTKSKGSFYLDNDDGTVYAHQYALDLPLATKICLTAKPIYLSQNQDAPPNPVDTCMMILKQSAHSDEVEFIGISDTRDNLQYYWQGDLRSGSYLLMPFTSGCRFRRRRREPSEEVDLVRRDQNNEIQLSKVFREALSDIFEMCDLDGNGLLSRSEFNWFQLLTSDNEVDDEEWQIVEDNCEMKKGELTREGFLNLHLMQARDENVDATEELLDTLQCMGYNKALDMDQACPFEVTVYASDCNPTLTVTSLNMGNDVMLTDKMVIKSVMHSGEKQLLKNLTGVEWYIYKSSTRLSSVLENKNSRTVEIYVDCSRMRNCVTCKNIKNYTLSIVPNSSILVDHIMPEDERQDWLYQCTISDRDPTIGSSMGSVKSSRPRSASKKGSMLSLF